MTLMAARPRLATHYFSAFVVTVLPQYQTHAFDELIQDAGAVGGDRVSGLVSKVPGTQNGAEAHQ